MGMGREKAADLWIATLDYGRACGGASPKQLDEMVEVFAVATGWRPVARSPADGGGWELRRFGPEPKPGRAPLYGTVEFYKASETPYGCLSNLYRRAMDFEGRTFRCAEEAYQFGKPADRNVADWLVSAPAPALMAAAAHGMPVWTIRPGWAGTRRMRMRKVVEAKFVQNPDLALVLIGTGNARLVEAGTEANGVNLRWGRVNGVGLNWLGEILQEVRQELLRKHRIPGGWDAWQKASDAEWETLKKELGYEG
jgi:ribA/ribD-fused uncharacterized protein